MVLWSQICELYNFGIVVRTVCSCNMKHTDDAQHWRPQQLRPSTLLDQCAPKGSQAVVVKEQTAGRDEEK